MRPALATLLQDSRVRYLIAGSTVFLVNVAAFQALRLCTPDVNWGRNLANVLATEVSYLYGYAIHALFTWKAEKPSWRGLGKFHLVSGFGFVLRSITFAVLDAWGVLPALACLMVSIGVQLCTNFLGYERWVFGRGKSAQ
jgi:putative flippase GtrA